MTVKIASQYFRLHERPPEPFLPNIGNIPDRKPRNNITSDEWIPGPDQRTNLAQTPNLELPARQLQDIVQELRSFMNYDTLTLRHKLISLHDGPLSNSIPISRTPEFLPLTVRILPGSPVQFGFLFNCSNPSALHALEFASIGPGGSPDICILKE